MLLKSKDDDAGLVRQLGDLLNLSLSANQRGEITREKAMLASGARAERDAAFEIDFRLKEHADWVVIHDLRLEHKQRTAQIDHLLIHPTNWEFYVVETKGVRSKLRIEGGQWSFLHGSDWRGMKNPIEQNARHIDVLQEILRDYGWLPRTLGVPVFPRFINVVVVPPDCLIQQSDELTWVLHMDEFVTRAKRDISLVGTFLNVVHDHSGEDARTLGEKLVSLHRPFQIDYRARFGIPPHSKGRQHSQTAGQCCASCKGPLSPAEAAFCRKQSKRFAGQLLCRKCQAYAPAALPRRESPTRAPTQATAARCAACAAPVDSKVVAFCRFNSKRFAKRILCRACQPKASVS
jgi:hypothetical protein